MAARFFMYIILQYKVFTKKYLENSMTYIYLFLVNWAVGEPETMSSTHLHLWK